MSTPHGFASLGVILVIVLVIAAAGASYYGAFSVPSKLNQAPSGASTTPVIATSTAETPAPVSQPGPTTPVATCAGRDPMKPYIISLSPTSGPAGTKVTIKGCNLAGFEADLNATFVRSDGKIIPLYAGTAYRKTPSVAEEQSMTVTVTTYCPTGSIIGLYSGAPQKCDTVEATPGAYSVYVETPSGKSNAVTFTLTGTGSSNPKSLPQQALSGLPLSGPAPLTVKFSLAVTDSNEQNGVYYTITFGDDAAAGFSRVANPSLSHTYAKAGTYTATVKRNTECSSWECLGPTTTVGTLTITVK